VRYICGGLQEAYKKYDGNSKKRSSRIGVKMYPSHWFLRENYNFQCFKIKIGTQAKKVLSFILR